MVTALGIYAIGSGLLLYAEHRLTVATGADTLLAWLNQHVYIPVMRALVIMVFICLAYPTVLGLGDAPPLAALLHAGRIDSILTAAFVISLALPVMPLLDRLPGTVLAVQGIIAVMMIAAWLGDQLGVPVALWVGWGTAGQVVGVLLLASLVGDSLVLLCPPNSRIRYAGLIREAVRIAAEIPAILLYGFALGRQFPEVYVL